MIIVDKERDQKIANLLNCEFLNCKRNISLVPELDEIKITSEWSLCFNSISTPMMKKTKELLNLFLIECMDLNLTADGQNKIIFIIDNDISNKESAIIQIKESSVKVRASCENGLLYAAMRIIRIFRNRKAPYLKKGTIENCPCFSPRISTTVFYSSDYKLPDMESRYTNEYLALMTLYGINGVFWEIDFWDFCNSDILAQLKSKNYYKNVDKLNKFVNRLAPYGIGVYLIYNLPVLPENHPVFKAHPDIKGALTSPDNIHKGYCLCSSNDMVLEFYEDAFANLHKEVSGLKGSIFLIGGERFMHCYTRPTPPLENKTNCMVCKINKASETVANMVNRVSKAIKNISPNALCFCWPYSAFTWSGPEDNHQQELINNLSDDVLFLSNFSTNDIYSQTNAVLYDYNIVLPGPSLRFRTQKAELRKRGKDIYAKVECSTTPLMFQVPYLPVPYRWHERAKALKKEKVKGIFAHWRYFGFTGNLADEILFESVWSDQEIDDILKQYCMRQYDEFSDNMLKGWRIMSEAWGDIPYSATLVGERQFYVKGPMYLGPAHPFIFNVQNNYNLFRGFTRIRGTELFPDVDDISREKLSTQAYSSDLLWTWPVGAEKCKDALLITSEKWTEGVKVFSESFNNLSKNAKWDIGICKAIGIHFKTTLNLIRFYQKRDAFLANGGSLTDMTVKLNELVQILEEEISNSSGAIELLKNNPEIGYGYSYGIAYDMQMIEEKIKQCQYVINEEIPKLAAGMRFHLYGVFP